MGLIWLQLNLSKLMTLDDTWVENYSYFRNTAGLHPHHKCINYHSWEQLLVVHEGTQLMFLSVRRNDVFFAASSSWYPPEWRVWGLLGVFIMAKSKYLKLLTRLLFDAESVSFRMKFKLSFCECLLEQLLEEFSKAPKVLNANESLTVYECIRVLVCPFIFPSQLCWWQKTKPVTDL